MAEVIRMPRMSDTMTEGTFVEWHKKVGDKVKNGDVLAEVETDKATMDLESYNAGTLLYIGVEKGKSAKVNQVIAIIGKEGEDYKALLQKETAKQEENAGSEEPDHKEKKDSKTEEAAQTKNEEKNKEEKTAQKEETESEDRVKASPLAKKIASEKGIPLESLRGSGDNGRIIRRDVENYAPETAADKISLSDIPQFTGKESYEDIPVSQMRKTIANRLVQSKFSAPHFYLTISVDMDNAIAARKSMNAQSELKISFNDIIVKACALALRRHPMVNASWMGDTIRVNHHIHIGVAVAVSEGLLVPVIRFADNKSLLQIAAETSSLAEKARNRKLQPADWEGNTFTISNLGMMDIDAFTAIINPPDACILAVGKISEVPVVKNGAVTVGNIMQMTMSCDHRVVDGAVGSRFLQTLKSYLEDPVRMLL